MACYEWTAIKPTELTKLTGSGQRVVERVDGTLFEVRGAFNVRIKTAAGRTTFSEPVHSRLSDDLLVVDGVDRPPMSFSLRNTESVEVSRLDRGATTGMVLGALAAGLYLWFLANSLHFPGP